MAHPCCMCGGECYCHGDIDDTIASKTPSDCETCGCEDFYDEDEEPEGDPDYWYCMGCGSTTANDPGGWGCPKCGSIMEPEYF